MLGSKIVSITIKNPEHHLFRMCPILKFKANLGTPYEYYIVNFTSSFRTF